MKVRALTTFGGHDGKTHTHHSKGEVFELPDGVDWLRAGLVEPIETAMMAQPTGRARKPLPVTAVKGIGPATATQLAELGVRTVADLAAADLGAGWAEFQEAAREMLR